MTFRITRLLMAFAVVVGLGNIGSVGIQTYALLDLKVNGPIYRGIVGGKDLIADILPPPLFLVEAYLLANEADIHGDVAKANLEKIAQLKSDYDARREYWKTFPLSDGLRRQLEDEVLPKADRIWKTLETQFGPALLSGDRINLASAMVALKQQFQEHRAAVVRLVDLANAFLAEQEAMAARTSVVMEWLARGGAGLSLLLFIAGVWFMHKRAIAPLSRMAQFTKQLAAGDFSREAPDAHRSDEIGDLAKSLSVFRQAGMDNLRLQQEARNAEQADELEKARRFAERESQAQELAIVVNQLGAGLARFADCNIRMTIDQPFAPDFETLRNDFNNSIATFQATLEQVLEKTRLINDFGAEMRNAAESLARRTEEQAVTLESTSASLVEITNAIVASSDKIGETRDLVRHARKSAESSQSVVRHAVDSMLRIESASQKIKTIVTVIDEIAFQTNLLALNASVEAARAGDAGKGFAVVAQEVRELAQRSAVAAHEIGGIIAQSAGEVDEGVRKVAETGTVLTHITDFVSRVDRRVDEVAISAREQTANLQQISKAVNEIDKMTQQNAAMVQETSAISHSLAESAALLTALVGKFKLNRRARIRESGQGAKGQAEQRAA